MRGRDLEVEALAELMTREVNERDRAHNTRKMLHEIHVHVQKLNSHL